MLDRLAEIRIPLMGRYEQWQANTSFAQFRSVLESVSPPRPKKRRNTHPRGISPPSSSSMPATSSDYQVTTDDARSHSGRRKKDRLERHKQVVAPVLPDAPDVVNVPSTKVTDTSDSVNVPLHLMYLLLILLVYRRLLK